MENLMNKPLIAVVTLALSLTPICYAEDWPSDPFLVVQGRAEIEVPPEKATVKLNVVAFEKESVAFAECKQLRMMSGKQ
jgi:uncharacterized protein YggE